MFKFTHPNLDATIMDDNVMCYKIPPNSYRKNTCHHHFSPALCERGRERAREMETSTNFGWHSANSYVVFPFCCCEHCCYCFWLLENHSLLHYLLLPCSFIQWLHLNLYVCVCISVCVSELCQKRKMVSFFFL